ncbi:MAG: ribosome silencing factor [Candidatus Riflebacteria bacterium]|nr:ribosome silencing factor [Candidatus Riflebacteria bacterium]
MNTEDKLKRILEILDAMKAFDVVTVNAAERTILADYFVLASATSDTHAKAIANDLHVKMKAAGVRASHVEADPGWEWTIVDMDDVVVHLFREKARRFYNLEELWGVVQTVRETMEAPPKKRRLLQRRRDNSGARQGKEA